MTGPEHYREAERHLQLAEANENLTAMDKWHQRQAQVHATLAVAAAALNGINNPGTAMPDWTEWRMAAGQPTAGEEQHERDGGQP